MIVTGNFIFISLKISYPSLMFIVVPHYMITFTLINAVICLKYRYYVCTSTIIIVNLIFSFYIFVIFYCIILSRRKFYLLITAVVF